ncbi:unnamed protein product [Euphydryas editha]|uniref:Reverse transcriptase n=1 Tax=Euphydryas editha TaxID=104508 RepID=A0AAU9TTY5_EUPED|nr:unnamed protein product [Euphydryas editha]
MIMTRKLKYETRRLHMGGVDIVLSNEVKLLGVVIDRKASWDLDPEVIRTIYRAVVKPVILYATGVWASAVDKLGIRKKLNVVQRGFVQKICRAYRIVSLNSPLSLARYSFSSSASAKLRCFIRRGGGVPQREMKDWEVERVSSALRSPHPVCHLDLEFKCLVDQARFIANNILDFNIFTDGSKIEGKMGTALSVWSSATQTKTVRLALPSYCTVYQAQRMAAENYLI